MALAAVNVTLGADIGGGRFNSVVKSRSLPLYDLTTTKADITAALSDITTTLGAITTALGLAGGAHNSTTELNTIQTDVTTVQTDVTTVQTDVNALALAIAADVSIVINKTNITTRAQLAYAFALAMRAFEGSDVLTP